MTNTETLIILIGGGIITILVFAGLLTMLPGFVCWALRKKETGDKLVKFGAACGFIAFSLVLVGVAWAKRSWIPLIMLVAAWVITFTQIKKNKKLKAEQQQ